jgi:hypothetical protein
MKTLQDRFDEKVEMIPFSDCWYWTAYRDRHGYGAISFGHKKLLAHRVAYELYVGPIPEGLCVLHTCHQGHLGCVAPHHLYAGTHADNVRDMDEAGNRADRKGSSNGRAKLTEEEVLEIRAKYEGCKYYQYQLAEIYGVSPRLISDIVRRETWSHV